MNILALYPADENLPRNERRVFNLYIISALVLFILLMLLGLITRMTQAAWDGVGDRLFYQLLTMHGAGMVGTVSLATTAVMWFFLRKYVRVQLWALLTNYVLFVLGTLAIVLSVFVGGYAGMWTFLYPLPVHSMGVWSVNAAALFMFGNLLVGFGLLVFYLDAAAAIIDVFGNLGRALGLQWLFRGEINQDHPMTVIVSTMVILANSLGILVGAIVLVMSLINAYFPSVTFDALLIKNLIYWFGHMFINATIYMGVIAVYELLPRYTARTIMISRAFLWAFAVTLFFVIIAFPHHMLMDYAEPRWLMIVGQLSSFGEGFPVFLTTAYLVLTNIYRSNISWKMPSRLIVLAIFGWAAGIIPAIIDATISVNLVTHNTQWVPGHFHFYLILGVLPMVLALMYHVIGSRAQSPDGTIGDKLGLPVYILGTLVFVLAFLDAGRVSVPRRYAVHLPEWLPYDKAGSIGAILIILGMLFFAIRIIAGLLKEPANVSSSHPAG